MRIGKTSGSPQPSLYVIPFEESSEILIAADLQPEAIVEASGLSGVVLGLDLPEGKALYLVISTMVAQPPEKPVVHQAVQLLGPKQLNGEHLPNLEVDFNWSGAVFRTYVMHWSSSAGRVDVYLLDDGVVTRFFSIALSSIGSHSAQSVPLASTTPVLLVGVEGSSGNQTLLRNLFVSTDPQVLLDRGTTREDQGLQVTGGDRVELSSDPLAPGLGAFRMAPETHIPSPDPLGILKTGMPLQWVKRTAGKTFASFREEPDFALGTVSEGVRIEGTMRLSCSAGFLSALGAGVRLFDGLSVFDLECIYWAAGRRCLGIRVASGGYIRTEADWSESLDFALEIDGRREEIRLFLDGTLALSFALDRSALPSAASEGLTGATPFLALGHIAPTQAVGTFSLENFSYLPLYQAWRASSGETPAEADPPFSMFSGSFPTDRGDGFYGFEGRGASSLVMMRALPPGRKAYTLEAELYFPAHKIGAETGALFGVVASWVVGAVTFIDSPLGKFCAVWLDGDPPQVSIGDNWAPGRTSFRVDWTVPHTYRLQLIPFVGMKVFVDGEERLEVPWEQLPLESGHFPFNNAICVGYYSLSSPDLYRPASTFCFSEIVSGFSTGFEVVSSPKVEGDQALLGLAYMEGT
jgi:hypothetical protein